MIWGGKREGAGRKPASSKGNRARVTVTLDPDLIEKLKLEESMSEVVNLALHEWYRRQKEK